MENLQVRKDYTDQWTIVPRKLSFFFVGNFESIQLLVEDCSKVIEIVQVIVDHTTASGQMVWVIDALQVFVDHTNASVQLF